MKSKALIFVFGLVVGILVNRAALAYAARHPEAL